MEDSPGDVSSTPFDTGTLYLYRPSRLTLPANKMVKALTSMEGCDLSETLFNTCMLCCPLFLVHSANRMVAALTSMEPCDASSTQFDTGRLYYIVLCFWYDVLIGVRCIPNTDGSF